MPLSFPRGQGWARATREGRKRLPAAGAGVSPKPSLQPKAGGLERACGERSGTGTGDEVVRRPGPPHLSQGIQPRGPVPPLPPPTHTFSFPDSEGPKLLAGRLLSLWGPGWLLLSQGQRSRPGEALMACVWGTGERSPTLAHPCFVLPPFPVSPCTHEMTIPGKRRLPDTPPPPTTLPWPQPPPHSKS